MLEASYGLNFFLKSPKKKTEHLRYIYLRVTVDGVPKETSTKMKWDDRRWDQVAGRAIGTKEDARTLNAFIDALILKINRYKIELIHSEQAISATGLISFVNGKNISRAKVLEEFQDHNDEMEALVAKGEFADGTHTRYVTARSHVQEFILFKYKRDDLEFRELNYEFVKDYEFYLKTVRNCSNNTTLKYISQFKKIVLRAIAKEIIPKDPFLLFKSKKTKIKKYPLTRSELFLLENKQFSSERLATIRDIFVFQCYTGLSYIDVYQLKTDDLKKGLDGRLWIMSNRQKTKSNTDIPLLPKALQIIEQYKNNPICIERKSVLPVKSNQKMNEYLKEIAELAGIKSLLNTHKARRTFASTITLNNGVPIHVVKELLGHHSIKETEKYAITEQESISREMTELNHKLNRKEACSKNSDLTKMVQRFEMDLEDLKKKRLTGNAELYNDVLSDFEQRLSQLKKMFSNLIAKHFPLKQRSSVYLRNC